MTIIEVNLGNFSSTGSIIKGIKQRAACVGEKCILAFPDSEANARPDDDDLIFGRRLLKRITAYAEIITGLNGCLSVFSTLKLLRKINAAVPSVIHLHNLHGSYINLPLLFRYIKKKKIPVVWTLHDCWSFTGCCPYFDMVGCDKWQTRCCTCPQYREYPKSLLDNSRFMYRLKRRWFTGVDNMTLVTPSDWLADLARRSFLKAYPVRIINNGIDLSVFKPTPSDFRFEHGIGSRRIVLGVAFDWGRRKGLDVFVELARRLNGERYQIVLVGTDDNTDKQLPNNIISIHRTRNQAQLAEIYSAADVFVNPTREENFPTVNMEALACGVPVITFKTGGSPEILDATCGSVVPRDDVDAMEKEILRVCEGAPYSEAACTARARRFDRDARFDEYIELYRELVK